MEEKNNKKYAGQVIDIPRAKSRLSFTDRLQRMTEEEGEPFLNIFSQRSIYLVSLFDFEKGSSLIVNIPVGDMPLIVKRTDCAEEAIFQLSSEELSVSDDGWATETQTEISPAFQPLRMGKLAGKAPGDMLLESSNKQATVATLTSQMEFLKQRVRQYPKNQADITAISMALDYFQLGILEDCKPEESQTAIQTPKEKTYIIYKTPVKHQKKIIDGMHPCYSVLITCTPTKEYPYRVELMNCYAPLGELKSGMKPVLMEQAKDIRKDKIDLTEAEWVRVVDCLKSNLEAARQVWYPALRTQDAKNRWNGNAS